MNCKEFEDLINDLACEHLMLANKRAQAFAHTESCPRCAARLAEERLLTERLRLVSDAEVIEAPARLKASLMAAFAERNGVSAAPVAATPVKFEPVNLAKPTAIDRRSHWAMAAAAAILVLLTPVTVRLLSTGSNAPLTTAIATTMPTLHLRESHPLKLNEPKTPVSGKQPGETSRSTSARHIAKNDRPRKAQSASVDTNQLAQNEVVTDYIPLTYMNDSTAFDSGSVVRVQVPRSTLISMGLPMNVENSSALVKADVVVGDDGVARAIRFVHNISTRTDNK
jgi:hypothetical protein